MRSILRTALLCALFGLSSSVAFAKDAPAKGDKKSDKAAKPINKICPVEGGEIDPEVTLTHKGKVIAFSSDTGEEADFDRLAGDADIFVCEATSQESDEIWEGHLRASQTGRIADRVGVKRLVLTHLRPGRDHEQTLAEARASADGMHVELAQDGSRLEL